MIEKITKSILDIINDTKKKIHPSIIKDVDGVLNKILQLQSDYLTITNDFSNSYYDITKFNKPSNDIDEQITQYLDEIRHNYTNKDISTVEEYIYELKGFHDKLVEFQLLFQPIPTVD